MLRRVVRARLEGGLSAVVDSTNLRRKDRLSIVECAPPGATIRYVLVDRPMDQKIASGGRRNDVKMRDGKPLMEVHARRFSSVLPDILSGDGNPDTVVLDLREPTNGACGEEKRR